MEPTFPSVEVNTILPTEPIEVTIKSNRICMRGKSASYVHHMEFDVSGTPLAGQFRPGQAIGVVPPGLDDQGRPEVGRLYSISSPTAGEDGQGNVVSTTCKRMIDEFLPQHPGQAEPDNGLFIGVASNYLCTRKPGDVVRVTGPAGRSFLLPENPADHDYVFLATGTGIAPFRGMIKDLLNGPQGPVTSQIHLVMGVPYTTDLLYDDLLREMAKEHANFHYHTVISRELDDAGQAQGYVHDYLARTPQFAEEILAQPKTLLYLCGLAGMQTGVYQYLASHGLSDGYLRIPDKIAAIAPQEWGPRELRRVRPLARCLLEVY